MKTLTITEARKNLSSWIRRAKSGEEIGIIDGNTIVALRPVIVSAIDYAESEYGFSTAEATQICVSIEEKSRLAEQAGEYIDIQALPHATASGKARKVRRR